MSTLKRILVIFVMIALVGVFGFAEGQKEGGMEAAQQRGDVQLAYVEWARCVAITHAAGAILDELGYNVSINNVANAAMWQSVAAGDSDAHLCAWLPVTHQMFYGEEGRFTDQVVKVDQNYDEAALGLVVPQYVDVNTIPELVNNASEFNSEIVGIDPGAGMMQATEEAINNDTYGLSDFTLLEGSGPTMTAALGDAIKNNEPVVVTGWKPHWKFARWDLKILEDPENQIFGAAETINTIVRQGLEEDSPELYSFFSNMDWQSIEGPVIGEIMLAVQDGSDPMEAAREIIRNNRSAVNNALPDGLSL